MQPKEIAQKSVATAADPKLKNQLQVVNGNWQLATGNRQRAIGNWNWNWIELYVASTAILPDLFHIQATGLKQSHQSPSRSHCCHIVHTNVRLAEPNFGYSEAYAYYHYHLTTVTTLYDMPNRIGDLRNVPMHLNTRRLAVCPFGQLIGPCSRNNFVANLLTVGCWSTCFIVAFIKRSTDKKNRTFIFLLNALDNATAASVPQRRLPPAAHNGSACGQPLDTPSGMQTYHSRTCRRCGWWRNDRICSTICKYQHIYIYPA